MPKRSTKLVKIDIGADASPKNKSSMSKKKVNQSKGSIVFFASRYWELLWMTNIVTAMKGLVYTNYESVNELIDIYKHTRTSDLEAGDILVTPNFHTQENYEAITSYLDANKPVVILQYAWDPQIQLLDGFWGRDVSNFSYYLTGCTQDKEWLSDKFGKEKIVNTGIPRLDDLYAVKHETSKALKPIYQQLKLDKFMLADIPIAGVYTPEIETMYSTLNDLAPVPVVYKLHPGGLSAEELERFASQSRSKPIFIPDDPANRFSTYRLIKAAQAVICVDSFMAIEASLLNIPVVTFGRNLIPKSYYRFEDRHKSPERIPDGFGSPLNHPHLTPTQKEVASWYTLDGKSTARVVKFLHSIL